MSGPRNGLPRRDLLDRVVRRTAAVGALASCALGLATAFALRLTTAPFVQSRIVVVLIACAGGAAGAVMYWVRHADRRTRASAAKSVEAAHPGCRNLLVTAEELERHPERADLSTREHVGLRASIIAAGIPLPTVMTEKPVLMWSGVLCAGIVAHAAFDVVVRAPSVFTDLVHHGTSASSGVRVDVTVTPPDYSGLPQRHLTDPARVEAIEGSRIHVHISGAGAGARIRFGDRVAGTSSAEMIAHASGYFAIDGQELPGTRLVTLAVTPDHVPSVRLTAPARDLLLASAREMPVALVATDDLGLSSVELRYTRVSGSGEQFEFVEGRAPIRIERRSDREWEGRGTLPLDRLNMQPGDTLVYRAVSRDRRAGDAGLGSSDTFLVEIAGPGQAVLESVDMAPELERYGMSQQMIVLKLERLRARESSLTRTELVAEAAGLAAEQRTVRATFIFLLGGHVEDEEEEAEASHEIQEGRLEHSGRRDLDAAIGHMTRAERGLTAVDTAAALPPARAAVEALQRAFGRNRYLLRSFAARSRLDPARRLTGDRRGATDWRRAGGAAPEALGEEARQILHSILGLSARVAAGQPVAGASLDRLAERALAVDPSAALWQAVSAELAAARGDDTALTQQRLQAAVKALLPEASRGAVPRVPQVQPASPLLRAHERQAP